MSSIIEFIKIIASITLSLTWFVSGLLINLVQLILYISVKPFSKYYFRKINYYLTYSSWSQLLVITEWIPGGLVNLRVFFKDRITEQMFGKEPSIAIANHSLEVDWLILWCLIDRYNFLSCAKAMAKRVIRYFPIMGWSWFFNEFIFLFRNWKKDEKVISDCLRVFLEYFTLNKIPAMILLFCEGTRRTEQKMLATAEFAKSKGLTPLKHHLIPRSKGFNFICQFNQQQGQKNAETFPALYNIQIAIRKSTEDNADFYALFAGKSLEADVFVERIEFAKVPVEETACHDWLIDLYRQKDDLMDYYEKQDSFPGIQAETKKRIVPLINSLVWNFFMISLFIYCLLFGNFWVIFFVTVFTLIGVTAIAALLLTTRANRGSSYGSTSSSSSSSTVTSDVNKDHKKKGE